LCRLLYLNNKAINWIDEDTLVTLLELLVKRSGGHGNGVGGVLSDGSWLLKKGVNLSTKEAADIILANDWLNGAIFHTRLASSGMITDRLCHPFLSLDRQVMLAHNGHFFNAESFLDFLTALEPNKYGKYVYGNNRNYYSYVYKGTVYYAYPRTPTYTEDDGKTVSDSWVLTEMLSFIRRIADQSVYRFYSAFGQYGNFFIQLRSGVVYLLVDYHDFQFWYRRGRLIAASSNLYELFSPVLTGEEVIVRVVSGIPKIDYGYLTKYFPPKNRTSKTKTNTSEDETVYEADKYYEYDVEKGWVMKRGITYWETL